MGSNQFYFQFDNSGDSANIEPCMTILRNLSGSLYGEMKIETQVVPSPTLYALGSLGDFLFFELVSFSAYFIWLSSGSGSENQILDVKNRRRELCDDTLFDLFNMARKQVP